jgi:glutamate carboxypeptidase
MQTDTFPTTELSEYLSTRLPANIDVLRQMVEINSFTTNPEGVNKLGNLTAAVFNSLGFQPEFVQSSNPNFGKHLFLNYPSVSSASSSNSNWKRSIALVAHLDTVFSPEEEKANEFIYRQDGDKIYGPGTVDIKGGTVMAFMVLDAIKKYYPQVFDQLNWLVCLDASEEKSSDDFGELCKERIPVDALACLIFEGGTPNQIGFPIVTSRKGRAEYLVSVDGRGAHAGNYHKQGANAIVQLADTIKQIASFTDYSQQITFNVGVVSGGSVVNRVPHHAEALVEMRAFSPDVFESGYQKMMSVNGSTTISSQDGYPCQVFIKALSRTAPWPRNERTERLFEIWSQAAQAAGKKVIPEERGGLSDGNLLWQYLPVLDGLGPSGTNAHCSERSADGTKDQEYALLSTFIPKALLNISAILHLVDVSTDIVPFDK